MLWAQSNKLLILQMKVKRNYIRFETCKTSLRFRLDVTGSKMDDESFLSLSDQNVRTAHQNKRIDENED